MRFDEGLDAPVLDRVTCRTGTARYAHGRCSGVGIALATYRQKVREDRRARWWERAKWAVAEAQGDAPRHYLVGFGVLAALIESSLTGAEEEALMAAIFDGMVGDEDVPPETTFYEVAYDEAEDGDERG